MEIKQLKYFLEAYRLQSFTEAAKQCIITPQGLHVSITRLEEELGCRLFTRNGSHLELTEAGRYLLPKAEEIVRISSEAEEHFSREAEKEGLVSVLFVRGTVELIALPSIAKFKEIDPQAEVRFKVEQDLDCVQAVLSGAADMAVCSGPIHSKDLSKKHLFTKKHMLVINSSDPLTSKENVSVNDLRNVHLALPREKMFLKNKVLDLCRKQGFEPDYIENDEPRTAFNCAQIGLQAGIVNEVSAGKLLKDCDNVSIIPFKDPEMDWEVFLIKKKDLQQTRLAKIYENCLLQTARKILER